MKRALWSLAFLLAACGDDDGISPNDAGPFNGKWQLVSSTLTAPPHSIACTLTATVRLYQDRKYEYGEIGGRADNATFTCGTTVKQISGLVRGLVQGGGTGIGFGMDACTCPFFGTVNGDRMTGEVVVYTLFQGGQIHVDGTFTATRVSLDPQSP